MKNKFIFRINTSNFITLLIMSLISLSASDLSAQRLFAPTEEGVMVEINNGPSAKTIGVIGRKGGDIKKLPLHMETILPEPCRIYIYSNYQLTEDDVYVSQIREDGTVGYIFYYKNGEGLHLEKIADSIYEISLGPNYFDTYFTPPYISKFAVSIRPSKSSKKQGLEKKFWYLNISETKYNPNKISKWSTEQAIESINQLMADGKTTEQLFASVKPQQVIPQAVNGQQVQYVVIQNQETSIPQNNQQSQEADKKTVEIVSDVDKNIPYRDINNENAFALIIANESYSRVASVPFANRDGNKLKEYLKKTMGLSEEHITFLENATLNDMRYEFSKLKKISDAYDGDCSFIVYYCGHGIPDEKNGNGYLLPVDGYGNDVSTAYALSDLYTHLGSLKAKKVVLFTDACFSGAGKEGDMLVSARGIAIKSNPNEAIGNLIAFSACQGDETAYSYKEKGHGLMTYYLLKKLQETGGKTSLGELHDYIIDNVGKTAIVINGKSQTPSVSVSPELQESWRDQTLFE